MKHSCHARDCDAIVPPTLLMCKKHWTMVPQPIQREVTRTYRPGQCEGRTRIDPQWLRAANAAVRWVADAELPKAGRWPPS